MHNMLSDNNFKVNIIVQEIQRVIKFYKLEKYYLQKYGAQKNLKAGKIVEKIW